MACRSVVALCLHFSSSPTNPCIVPKRERLTSTPVLDVCPRDGEEADIVPGSPTPPLPLLPSLEEEGLHHGADQLVVQVVDERAPGTVLEVGGDLPVVNGVARGLCSGRSVWRGHSGGLRSRRGGRGALGRGLTYVRVSSTKLLERKARMSRFSSMYATYNGGRWEMGGYRIREAWPNFECGAQAALFIPHPGPGPRLAQVLV